MKRFLSVRLVIFNLVCIGALMFSAFTPLSDGYWARQLRQNGKMNLPVTAILQSKYTSCGEASIVMAYNYAYPEMQVSEQDVTAYAVGQGYYTERRAPYTSPENMANIARHYADTVSTGTVDNADEGLAFLTQKLTSGEPVIIDTLARLDDPASGAHFVVVTGLAIDPANPNAVNIYFNDPLMGLNRSSDWFGSEGVWNAWQNNGDPGGSGWWMTIASP